MQDNFDNFENGVEFENIGEFGGNGNRGVQMPQKLDAERAVLGCIFIDPNLLSQAQSALVPNDFFDIRNKSIYDAFNINFNNNTKNDFTTVKSALENAGNMERVTLDYLASIVNLTYSVRNFESYIDLVVDASIKRQAINTLDTLLQAGYDSSKTANDYLTDIEKAVFSLTARKKSENFVPVSTVLNEVKENVELHQLQDGSITGLNTGIDELNNVTLGFQKQALIILAARPAMGKSAMALNLAKYVAKLNPNTKNPEKKAVVAIFSLEMASEQLVERMIASEGRISLNHLKSGNLEPSEWRMFEAASNTLGKLNLYFDDSSSVTIDDIRTKCRKLSIDEGLDFVIIDYLQLIESEDSRRSKQEEVSKISRSLKLMARELDIPVVALAQLSREVEKRETKIPIMADLRDSGSIEQDADIVTFLYRDDYYNKESERVGEADLIIAKNRSGASGREIAFNFQGEFANFMEIKK